MELSKKYTKIIEENGGAIFEVNGTTGQINMPASGVFEVWKHFSRAENRSSNFNVGGAFSSSSKNSFYGGGPVDFSNAQEGSLDISPFLSAKKKVSGITKELSGAFEEIAPQRKRRRDEFDGELDLDKRFEAMPYMRAVRDNTGIVKTIVVNVEFSFNCGVGADEISRYGAFCWSIIDALESSGVLCEVNLVGSIRELSLKAKHTDMDFCVNVKKSSEYIESIELARRFRTDFFRRGLFSIYMLYCAATKGTTAGNLGYSKNSYKNGQLIGNELRLKINDATKFDAKSTIASIKKAIGVIG